MLHEKGFVIKPLQGLMFKDSAGINGPVSRKQFASFQVCIVIVSLVIRLQALMTLRKAALCISVSALAAFMVSCMPYQSAYSAVQSTSTVYQGTVRRMCNARTFLCMSWQPSKSQTAPLMLLVRSRRPSPSSFSWASITTGTIVCWQGGQTTWNWIL